MRFPCPRGEGGLAEANAERGRVGRSLVTKPLPTPARLLSPTLPSRGGRAPPLLLLLSRNRILLRRFLRHLFEDRPPGLLLVLHERGEFLRRHVPHVAAVER